MEAGVFGKDGNLNESNVGMALGEGSNAGLDGPASLAPRRIPQDRKHFVLLARLVQGLFVFFEVSNIRDQLVATIRFRIRRRRR